MALKLLLGLCLGGVALAQNIAGNSPTTADLILKNAKVYTDHDAGRTWSQAISVRNGNILAIGTNAAIEKDKGPTTRVIDLKGRVVLPGFNDAHVHFLEGGLSIGRLDVTGVTTVAKLQEKLKAYAAANPQKRWLFGGGWDHTAFPGQKYPTRDDLDAAVNDRPVMLWHTDHHLMVVNSKALELLKINASTPNPPNGEIQKNSKGEPNGVLLEAAALEASNKFDNPSREELKQAFKAAQEQAARFGVTSVQGGPIRGEEEVKIVEDLYNANQLTVRYSMWGDLENPEEFLALKEKYKHLTDDWVRFEAVKGFLDGVLSARTAALIEPYHDDPKTRGEPSYSQPRLNELVLAANRLGLPVALHAIGDRAVTMAVSAYANAKHLLFNSRVRNRIEHLEVVPAHIYPKFRELGIIASMQPSHMVYDNESQNYNDARLGSARVKHAFAWRNFFNARAHVAFGTDWPVMPLNPMVGLFAAVNRQHYNGKPYAGWQPSQKISLDQAIEAYTLGAAYATREEHVKGSLREGKYADIVVLDQDPFRARGKDMLKIPAYMTIVSGKIVFDGSQPQIGPATTPVKKD